MAEKRKCRQYSVDYLKFGFIPSPSNEQLPMCLICEAVFSNEAMKPSRLSDHLKKKHSYKANEDVNYFRNLKERHEKRTTAVTAFFKKTDHQKEKGLVASYKISLMIAKCAKPHTIGETLILPAVKEVITTVMECDASSVLSSIPLSNNSVSRRIDDMAKDVETKLCDDLKNCEFGIQLDESTVRDSETLLMAYVRYIRGNTPVEELLFARSLTTNTRGESIYNVLKGFIDEKGIPLCNIVACATDGAPAMIGRQRGFIAHLRTVLPDVFAIHCVIHRQHLVAKALSERLNTSLTTVIKAVNVINARPHYRIFRQLYHQNEEDFERLLFHTEVRWLSKGKCITRFYALYESVVEFLQQFDTALAEAITSVKHDIAYLCDFFEKMNEMNLKLQGEGMNLIRAKGIVLSFISKLTLFKQNLARHELYQFPKLLELNGENRLTDNDLEIYCIHLDRVKEDMLKRFKDLKDLAVPEWII